MTKISVSSPKAIKQASKILQEGGIVALPTETVYGLAANAIDEKAVAKIFSAKKRPSFNPLIIHLPNMEEAQKYAEFNDIAKSLAARFWPGALTMILPKKKNTNLSNLVTAGLDTIAIRVPANKIMQQVLKISALPLAAPSANKSGTPSPTTAEHVAKSLGSEVDMILAAGKCELGLESTIIDMTSKQIVILRPGAIIAEDIEDIIGYKPEYDFGIHKKPKSPGQTLRHYAPSIPIRLNAVDIRKDEALLAFGSTKFMGIRGGGRISDLPDYAFKNLSEKGDLYEAASNLFLMLRELDNGKNKSIAVMNIPNNEIGIAINERLERAASS